MADIGQQFQHKLIGNLILEHIMDIVETKREDNPLPKGIKQCQGTSPKARPTTNNKIKNHREERLLRLREEKARWSCSSSSDLARYSSIVETCLHPKQPHPRLWQNLVLGETGLGRDSETGAIAASYDWWDLKLMRHPGCAKFRDKPLPLEDEMRILFGSNTATGEHKYTPSLGFLPAALGVRITPNVDPKNIDALLDDDDEIQELVHPTESLQKRRANNSVAKKTIPKGKKVLKAGNFCHQMSGSATSRLEACLQQINSTDSASSPSVQRSVDIPTLKEAADTLNELPEFKDDSDDIYDEDSYNDDEYGDPFKVNEYREGSSDPIPRHNYGSSWRRATAEAILNIHNETYMGEEPCRTSAFTGAKWIAELNVGHPKRMYQAFRMSKTNFLALCELLESRYGLREAERISVQEQVTIFLWIVGQRANNRSAQERFQRSGETISRRFHHVLDALNRIGLDHGHGLAKKCTRKYEIVKDTFHIFSSRIQQQQYTIATIAENSSNIQQQQYNATTVAEFSDHNAKAMAVHKVRIAK
ncbi:hypothetical protein Vadar_011431 [Vaccinium darrowii]|uniref:Uncharacterized protein n=1 Tax=Vaccinium darrowii TaxID=229202 RepID=A0ACB7XI14_9ERIC|nr:hypothetical protein Vadar_011431 [Vaccinium darrowii]